MYASPYSLLPNVSGKDKVMIFGDFNAGVGRDWEVWKGVLGKYGVWSCDNNGHLFQDLCTNQQRAGRKIV